MTDEIIKDDVDNDAVLEPGSNCSYCDEYQNENRIKKERRSYVANEVKEWVKSIVIALVLALVIKAVIVQAYMIPTGSMEPTIQPGDRVFGNRFIFRFRDPVPGDIIAFKPPDSVYYGYTFRSAMDSKEMKKQKRIPYLKRVIAVPGDRIKVVNGMVYRNDIVLDEPYVMNDNGCSVYDNFPGDFVSAGSDLIEVPEGQQYIEVPEGMIFVLGDNRCNSHDGHRWGFLPVENIQAKAFFRFWPPNRIGSVR